MPKNLILHDEQPIVPPTALHVSERIWSHAYYDAKIIDGAFTKAVPLAVAFSIIAAGMSSDASTAQEIMQNSITAGFSVTSAYLARAIYESRKKLDFMRRNFEVAARGFKSHETALTRKLKRTLDTHRPSIPEMFDLKKYPIRTSFALAFSGAAALTNTGQEALIAMGSTFFLMGVAAHEQNDTQDISQKAMKATKFLQTVNQLRIMDHTL